MPPDFGPYRPLAPLGRGGMGQVWRAMGPDGTEVAVKCVPTKDPGQRAALRRELTLLGSLAHPGVVPLVDHGETDAGPWLATAILPGPTLGAWLAEHTGGPPTLDAPTLADEQMGGPAPQPITAQAPASNQKAVLAMLGGVAHVLAFLHGEGLVHADLKPANVLVVDGAPVLVDFGLAEAHGLAPTGGGSAPWMSPERIRGESIDGRADLYALGVMLFEALTGTRPFQGTNTAATLQAHLVASPPSPRAFVPDLDPAVEEIVLALLARSPQARSGWAGEVAQALGQAAGGQAFHAVPVPRPHLLRPRLVGRAAVLDQVGPVLQPGGPHALHLVGPAGSGRTATLDAAIRLARRSGHRVLVGRARGPGPLSALRPMLPELADTAGQLLDDAVGHWLRGHLPAAGPPPQTLPPGSAGAVRQRLTRLLGNPAGTVVVAVDEATAADALSQTWLASLRRGPPGNIRVLTTGDAPVSNAHCVTLTPLGLTQTGDVVADALGVQACPPQARVIVDAAGGHPGLALTWLQVLLNQGALVRTNGVWAWPSPEVIAAVVTNGLDPTRLSETELSVAVALSVLGQGGTRSLAEVAALPEAVVAGAVQRLERAGWVNLTGSEARLTPGVAPQLVDPAAPRAQLHQRAAATLAQDPTRLAERAQHLLLGGDAEGAGNAFWRAGHEARAFGDLEGAVAAWQRAAEILPTRRNHLDVLICTHAWLELGRVTEAEAGLHAVLAAAPTTADRVAALSGLGRLRWRTGRVAEAEACYREQLALCADNAFVRATALADLGSLLHEKGQLEEAFAMAESAIALLTHAKEADGQPAPPGARSVAEQADVNRAIFTGNAATALLGLGRVDQAVARLEQANAIAESHPDWQARFVPIWGSQAVSLLRMGRLGPARAGFRRVLRVCQHVGDSLNECVTWQFLARVAQAAGGDPEADLTSGLALAELHGFPFQQVTLLLIRAEHRRGLGEFETAAEAARRAEELASGLEARPQAHQAALTLAAIAREAGQHDAAAAHLARATAQGSTPPNRVAALVEGALQAHATGSGGAKLLAEAEAAAENITLTNTTRSRLAALRSLVCDRP